MGAIERAEAEKLDADDELAGLRDRFVAAPPAAGAGAPEPIYLLGNSLGRQPKAAGERIAEGLAQWASVGVGGWHKADWLDLPRTAGDLLGAALLGAGPGQVAVADNTTVNLYKLAAGALADRVREPGRRVIVTDRDNFCTDRYVLAGLAEAHGGELRVLDADPVDGPDAAALAPLLAPGDVALVSLSLVAFRSAAVADLAAITRVAHDAGAVVLWDLSHAVGAVPIDLDGAGVDLAVGCSYKYLNGGPGAPAFLYVRRDLQDRLTQPVQGWFAQRDQFAMGPDFDPVPDLRRFLTGTPNVLGTLAVRAGVEVLAEAGMGRLRAKSVALTGLLLDLHDAWLAPLGFTVASPRDAARRGGHVALRHPEAATLRDRLEDEAGVQVDFRPPDTLRFAPAAVSTRFVDVWDAVDRVRWVVEG